MSDEPRLAEASVGAGLAWLLTLLAWLAAHVAAIAGAFAVLASIYSIRAARETIALRREERRKLLTGGNGENGGDR